MVASLFGLLLAFVVVIEFQAFSSAEDNVAGEADGLAAILRDSRSFERARRHARPGVDRQLRADGRARGVAADAQG